MRLILNNYARLINLRLSQSSTAIMTLTTKSSKKIKDTQTREISDSIQCERSELDLGITLKGGQSFRWVQCKDENSFRGVFCSTVWTLLQNDEKLVYTVHGSLKKDIKYDEVMHDYFRFDVSLKDNLKIWANVDKHFETYNEIGAVRILNQDVIENLFHLFVVQTTI